MAPVPAIYGSSRDAGPAPVPDPDGEAERPASRASGSFAFQVEVVLPCPVLGPRSAGPAPGLAGCGGDVGLAVFRLGVDEYASYSSGGDPIRALGGCSTVELRTAPEPPLMEVLGVTFESTDGADSDGTVAEGTLVAPSVVTAGALEPQFVHGAVTAAGLAKIGR